MQQAQGIPAGVAARGAVTGPEAWHRSASRIVLASAALALVLVAFVGFGIWRGHDEAIADAGKDTQNLARVIAAHARQEIEAVDLNLASTETVFRNWPSGKAITGAQMDWLLRGRLKLMPNVRILTLTDRNGVVLHSVGETAPAPGALRADREYFTWGRDHGERALHISAPVFSRSANMMTIPLSRRLSAADGSFEGVLFAALTPQFWQQLYSSVDTGEHGLIAILKRDGTLLARGPHIESLVGTSFAQNPLFREHLPRSEQGSYRQLSPSDGRDKIYSYAGVPHTDLVVMVGFDKDEYLYAWRRQSMIDVSAMAVLLSVLALFTVMVIRQMRAQHELVRNVARGEARYRSLIDTANEGVLKVDGAHRITLVNAKLASLLGYDQQEMMGRSPDGFVADHDLPRYRAAMRDRLALGSLKYVLHLKRKDGGIFPVMVSANSVYDADGDYVGALAMITDISDRLESELILRESEARYRRVIETANDGLWQTDTERRTTFVNARLAAMLGYSAEELLGRAPGEFMVAEDRRLLAQIEEHRDSGLAQPYPLRFVRKDGSVLWTTSRICSTFDDKGTYTGKIALVADISERVEAEEKVRQQLKRLEALHAMDQAILEAQSREAIAAIGLAHVSGLVPCWGATVMSFDFTANECVVLNLTRVAGSPYDPGPRLSLDDFGRDDIAWLQSGKERVVPDMDCLPLLSNVLKKLYALGMRSYVRIPLLAEGELVGTMNLSNDRKGAFTPEQVAMARSIADQLAIALRQAALREQVARQAATLEQRVAERTAQLAAVNRELESFTASVSHDLRAPARHIDGFATMLLQDAKGLDASVTGTLQRITRAARRMNTLIDDLLSLARTGTQELHKTDFDMNALVREEMEDLAPQMGLRKINWNIAALPVAHGDAALLRVVMHNLLGNAIKYSARREDAVIEVESRKSASGSTEYVVRDNGAGFDMAYAGKLFGVFSRLHSEKEFEGTGIGLATVQRIINRHGGHLQAFGKVGEGAEFSFTLA
jgi:PAS domain S-box-containing protein